MHIWLLRIRHGPRHRQRWLMRAVLVALVGLVTFVSYRQLMEGRKRREFRSHLDRGALASIIVYDVEGSAQVKSQELQSLPSSIMPPDLAHDIIANAAWHRGYPVWQGSRLAVMHLTDGNTEQMSLCLHGAYYVIRGHGGYYEIAGDSRVRFTAWLHETITNHFIPQRRERNRHTSGPFSVTPSSK